MKAVVFHGIGDIRLDDVPEPKIKEPTDAIVRLSASAICGTDLHMVRGTLPGMKPGTTLGHEGVGVVEEIGGDVHRLHVGDRVVICSTVCCGHCSYCKAGYHSQCDNANPNGAQAGTAFFGGPMMTGPIDGLQAEFARVPHADCTAVPLPEAVDDDQAILLSDIFPTGYFGADLAEIKQGDTVAVFGCGPVGLFTVLSARLFGAERVFAIDCLPDRLAKARELGAETVNFNDVEPASFLMEATDGIGVLRTIDAVGVDAVRPKEGPAAAATKPMKSQFKSELKEVAPTGTAAHWWRGNWQAGDAPSMALQWGVQSLAKAGTLSVIGVYPQSMNHFPIGMAMLRNLTLQMGNCPHRKYMPKLIDLVASGEVEPTSVLSHIEPIAGALEAYKEFDQRAAGWLKVELQPALAGH